MSKDLDRLNDKYTKTLNRIIRNQTLTEEEIKQADDREKRQDYERTKREYDRKMKQEFDRKKQEYDRKQQEDDEKLRCIICNKLIKDKASQYIKNNDFYYGAFALKEHPDKSGKDNADLFKSVTECNSFIKNNNCPGLKSKLTKHLPES